MKTTDWTFGIGLAIGNFVGTLVGGPLINNWTLEQSAIIGTISASLILVMYGVFIFVKSKFQ